MTQPAPHEALSSAFFRLVRGFRLIERGAKCCEGVTLPQCTLIETLAEQGSQRLSVLARMLGVKVSTATRLVDTLVRQGHLEKKSEPGDARVVLVALTAEGTLLAGKLSAAGAAFSALILERIPEGERERTVETIARVAQVVESIPGCITC